MKKVVATKNSRPETKASASWNAAAIMHTSGSTAVSSAHLIGVPASPHLSCPLTQCLFLTSLVHITPLTSLPAKVCRPLAPSSLRTVENPRCAPAEETACGFSRKKKEGTIDCGSQSGSPFDGGQPSVGNETDRSAPCPGGDAVGCLSACLGFPDGGGKALSERSAFSPLASCSRFSYRRLATARPSAAAAIAATIAMTSRCHREQPEPVLL